MQKSFNAFNKVSIVKQMGIHDVKTNNKQNVKLVKTFMKKGKFLEKPKNYKRVMTYK